MSGRYAEVPPRADIAAHVACLWSFEADGDASDQRIVPDGRCELIVHCGPAYLERGADGALSVQPPALFAGQLVRPLHLRAAPGAVVVAARFHPAGALAYVGAPVARFTDRRASLDELEGPGAAQALARGLALRPHPDRLAGLQEHVAAVIAARGSPRDLVVERCVAGLEAEQPLEALRRTGGLSARALQRRFARAVGLPPQSLAAVFRLRRLFEALHDASVETWTAAAQAAGYFDHPQMARDFRRFVGCTPSEFVAGGPGLAASLVGLPD